MAMSAAVASSLISGGAGLLGSLGNMFSQIGANDKNIQIARENRDFYYQQWMRENAYNDPSAMMQRLARAGLNPNLMYGDGASGLPAAASMPSVEAARVSAPQVDPLVMAQAANIAADTMLKKSQAKKTESDIRVNEGVIRVNDSVALYNGALASMTKAQQDYIIGQTRMLGTLTEEVNSKIALNYASIRQMDRDAYFKRVELGLKKQEVDALCDKYAADTGWTKEQTKYAAVLAMAKVRNLDADTLLKKANVDLTEEEKKKVVQETANLSVVNGQLNWSLQMDKKYGDTDRSLQQSKVVSSIVSELVSDASVVNDGSRKRVDMFNSQNGSLPMPYPQSR